MDVRRLHSVDAFLALAGDFLGAREAEHNLIFGICASLAADASGGAAAGHITAAPPLFAVVVDGGHVAGAALQTPPRDLVLSEMDDPLALSALIDDLIGVPLPGVIGPPALSGAFAEAWSRRTGTPTQWAMSERIFRLAEVRPPRTAPGTMVAAGPGNRQLIVDWLIAFVDEAFAGEELFDAGEAADRWIAGRGRTMWLWVDDGRVVSMSGVSGRTPNGVRIGPVYTPPEARNRGYASNLVAEAAQGELDDGRQFVFLFTDLANPTSNHIYQAIGFEPVSDVDRHVFR
ncbi:MAG: GNAT family N-acetyltransferase [Chloroflexota bacterium]